MPSVGNSFQIISNDAADARSGTFFTYSDADSITNFLGSGITVQIICLGGTGDELVIGTNRPPVPGVVSVQRYPTQSVKIPVAQITGAATVPACGTSRGRYSPRPQGQTLGSIT